MPVFLSLLVTLRTWARSRAALHLEVLPLPHQLQVLQRGRLRLAKTDRLLWSVLSCIRTGWQTALVIGKPETVIAWHPRASGCGGGEERAPHGAANPVGRRPHADSHDGAGEPR